MGRALTYVKLNGRASHNPALSHMWTAPSSQGVVQCFDQIACVHMSGLSMRSHMNAGQDGFRDRGSIQHRDLDRRPLAQTECPASWID